MILWDISRNKVTVMIMLRLYLVKGLSSDGFEELVELAKAITKDANKRLVQNKVKMIVIKENKDESDSIEAFFSTFFVASKVTSEAREGTIM